ncbi:ENHANCER OF AG-4 protein 2-like isoform X1 [Gracilaria domingensis]|nr:ENHANCER OF AG-4 protein 2-like isoform X1 [Gracilaria domingensis]
MAALFTAAGGPVRLGLGSRVVDRGGGSGGGGGGVPDSAGGGAGRWLWLTSCGMTASVGFCVDVIAAVRRRSAAALLPTNTSSSAPEGDARRLERTQPRCEVRRQLANRLRATTGASTCPTPPPFNRPCCALASPARAHHAARPLRRNVPPRLPAIAAGARAAAAARARYLQPHLRAAVPVDARPGPVSRLQHTGYA